MTQEKWLAEETRGQKWRRLTPLGILTAVSTNFVGWGIIVWFLCYFVQANDKKFDLDRDQIIGIVQDVKEVKAQEAKDVLCLSERQWACCGIKANVSC